jgi:hypothetical protein
MTPPIFVSPDGFVSCPACLQHVRASKALLETVCPFCAVPLRATDPSRQGGRALTGLLRGRTAPLIAALTSAGLSFTIACSTPSPTGDSPTSTSPAPLEEQEEVEPEEVAEVEQAPALDPEESPVDPDETLDDEPNATDDEDADEDEEDEEEKDEDELDIDRPDVREHHRTTPVPAYGGIPHRRPSF